MDDTKKIIICTVDKPTMDRDDKDCIYVCPDAEIIDVGGNFVIMKCLYCGFVFVKDELGD